MPTHLCTPHQRNHNLPAVCNLRAVEAAAALQAALQQPLGTTEGPIDALGQVLEAVALELLWEGQACEE